MKETILAVVVLQMQTLHYIEQQYNQSRAQAFRYVMTSEGELLAWLNKCSACEK